MNSHAVQKTLRQRMGILISLETLKTKNIKQF